MSLDQPVPRNPDLRRLSVMMMVLVESRTNSTINENDNVRASSAAKRRKHVKRVIDRLDLLLFVSVAHVTWMNESLKSSLIKHSLNF